MNTDNLFQEDAYQTNCEATVLVADQEGIILDRTVFYPLGGGQPGDTGALEDRDGNKVTIVDTRKSKEYPGCILHLPDEDTELSPSVGDVVRATIDWERRYRHMRMHTCLHLLGAILPYGVTGGNIGAEKSRLDFDMEEIPDKDELTEKLNELVQQDHLVSTRWITDEELEAQPELIRTMSVKPPRGAGRVRLLEVEGIDLQPCGGTHVKRTNEIGQVRISKIEKKGRHNRRVYVVFDDD